MGVRKWFFVFLWALLLVFLLNRKIDAEAAYEGNPYISLSPDKQAFTTNAGEKDYEWYERGTRVYTGVESTLSEPQKGQHYYDKAVEGRIPVGSWEVVLGEGVCIHKKYPATGYFHGITYGKRNCKGAYYSGWGYYCADCGALEKDIHYYMSDLTAKSITYIDTNMAYFYKCPHCDNLEQGTEQDIHMCKGISDNRYFVQYQANSGSGYMAKSVHMYNNSTLYEGKEVTPQITLNLNMYTKRGYRFDGWNTMADGSGEVYEDGAVIYNLTDEEGGIITLYAQWEECTSILEIDPAGGTYQGKTGTAAVEGAYGECCEILSENVVAPLGYIVHFETQGGSPVEDCAVKRQFMQWSMSTPFFGEMQENTYVFGGEEGAVDRITAIYEDTAILLPETQKEGYSFGGWFMDEECTKPVGHAGDSFLPGKDMTLYAGWVDLQLISKDNYTANAGKGAVDLSWSQKDDSDKVYGIYQRMEGADWVQLSTTADKSSVYETDVTMNYSGREGSYTVPFSGFYKLTLCGAQGGNYLNNTGGLGGRIWAYVYLEKGDKLSYTIGGQEGFGGGGTGTKYANGGGFSVVSHDEKGVLLIAGGGGGASLSGNGQAGGLEVSVVEGNAGENGASGGGGGYRGGSSGVLEMHTHSEECSHKHVGEPSVYGGCYTVAIACQGTEFTQKEEKRTFYYGNIEYVNGVYQSCYCVRCGSYSCPGHLDIKYSYKCVACDATYEKKPGACTAQSKYALGCEREESFICGMEEGEVIADRPAFGGSSYINGEWCFNYGKEAGVQTGNGMLRIEAQQIGMLQGNQLSGVEATDWEPPMQIAMSSVKKTAVDEDHIRIAFDRPDEVGTTYYHQVKSYDKSTGTFICISNQTVNTLISGVRGYYYRVDGDADTCVNEKDMYYAESGKEPFLVQEIAENTGYLHVAAVDKAGNIAPTIHIEMSAQDVIYWPLRTEQIEVEPGSNVKQVGEENTYFVKADSHTPVTVGFEGVLCGTARADYQIGHMSFEIIDETVGDESTFTVITPRQEGIAVGTFTYPMQSLRKTFIGTECLQDDGYTVTKRYNMCRSIALTQKFTVDTQLDGHKICLQPQVGANSEKGMIYSDIEEDRRHALWLIADGKGPELEGLDVLEKLVFLDFTQEKSFDVRLRARDGGSGLARFYVEINNLENGMRVQYEDVGLTGEVSFEISGEEQIFNGKFEVMAYAVDAVGNETLVGTQLLGVSLSAYVERILPPHNGVFKRGESGILHIQTTGYVERVEVSFPEVFEEAGMDYNQTYIYEKPNYIQTEELEFLVPLTIPDGTQRIQVKAYKEGTELESTPQLVTVLIEGSVLDELRTRLR